MGERPTKIVIEAFSPLAQRQFADFVRKMLTVRLPSAEPTPATATDLCPLMHGEPLTRGHLTMPEVAFLDDRDSLRWVDAGRVAEVPTGWRPLLVGNPVKPRGDR